jgi:glycosyltransferase involved in cell wall biosynthesis
MKKVWGCGSIANRFANFNLQSRHLVFVDSIHNANASNSTEISNQRQMLRSALATLSKSETFVYFSSCDIDNKKQESSPFLLHKIWAEQLVQESANNYLIVRLPEVFGLMDAEEGIVSSLISKIHTGARFRLPSTQYNFIDLDHVYAIVSFILDSKELHNTIVNVASSNNTSTLDLMLILEEYLGKAGNYEFYQDNGSCEIDISSIRQAINCLDIDFGKNYLRKCVEKYYEYYLKPAPLLSIIVPTYNQSLGINEFYRRTKLVLDNLGPRFRHELIFINDCSPDDTWLKLKQLATSDLSVKVINFSRNFGNQIGIAAGVKYCRGNLAIIIDDDLQDPPEIILDFIAKWQDGYQVVYGVRPKRHGVNPIFQLLAKVYYRIISALSDTSIPQDTGDFRLIDGVVLKELRRMREENRYYRGMVSWVGFSQVGFIYERDRRYAGKSNFSFSKYLKFAINGLTSFTDKPLYFSCVIGFCITTVSFMLATYLIIYKLVNPEWSIRGWSSIMALTMFFGGVQLFSLGIIGIYVSKIYREVKGRPLFVVRDLINLDDQPMIDVGATNLE